MNNGASNNKPVSFAELQERDVVEPKYLIESLADYALNGWAISGDVVVSIAQRTDLGAQDLQRLGLLSYKGIERQLAGGNFNSSSTTRNIEAKQYATVAGHAETCLASIAQSN